MPCPPDLLVTPSQLSRYGVPSDFLAQFILRPIVLRISTGGVLGVMQFVWRYASEDAESAPIASSGGSAWATTIEEAYADISFDAGTYVENSTYSIDANGNVTPSTGGLPSVTPTLFDLRQNACSSVSTEAMYRMRNAISPPLLTWGDDARTHAAAWVYAKLKRSKGATPEGAGLGDENVFAGEKLAIQFFDKIGMDGRPDSMTDTSSSADGPLFPAYPSGDALRRW